MKKYILKLFILLFVAMFMFTSIFAVQQESVFAKKKRVSKKSYKVIYVKPKGWVKAIKPKNGQIFLKKYRVKSKKKGRIIYKTAYRVKVAPYKGYRIYKVYVNGRYIGNKAYYKFINPRKKLKISAKIGHRVRVVPPKYGLNKRMKLKYNVLRGGNTTITIKPDFRYRLTGYYVNGVRKNLNRRLAFGQTYKVKFTNIRRNIIVKPMFRRAKAVIRLDAGHQRYENKGRAKGYYESIYMWKYTEFEYKALKRYKDICVVKTRYNQKNYLSPDARAYRGRYCDLLVSNHSNWSSKKTTDYPLVLIQCEKKYYEKTRPIARKLIKNLRVTMKTKQTGYIWSKKMNNGKNWYGLLRGAAAVNCPAMIVEHSFHSNYYKCRWLMDETNLKILAEQEADIIARSFGLELKDQYK